jgi:single-strand DNA-binding protein
MRDWKDQNGNKRRNAEVIADNVYFGDSKKESSAPSFAEPSFAAPESQGFVEIEDDSELPF